MYGNKDNYTINVDGPDDVIISLCVEATGRHAGRREHSDQGGSVLVCVIQCVKNNEEMTARLVASSFSLACSLVIL